MRRIFLASLATALIVASGSGVVVADTAERVADGHHLAAVLRAARSVVSNNQPLINDPSKGDKGLTPEVFLDQLEATYTETNNQPLLPDDLSDLQRRLITTQLEAVSEVVAEHQGLINTPDMGFKGFIPAVFARLVNERFGEKIGGIASVKVTAPPDLVRNRKARPDGWETAVIEDKFLAPGWDKGAAWYEMVEGEQGPAFRMLIPEYYSASCLSCHGEPAGEVDVTGFPKEGGQVGDLGGAISITLNE